jgi:hypothetical protein
VPTCSLDVWPLKGVPAVVSNSYRTVTTNKRNTENPKLHFSENNLAEIDHSFHDPSFVVTHSNTKLSEQLERNIYAGSMQGERVGPELSDSSVEGFRGRQTRVVDVEKSSMIDYSSRSNILVPEVSGKHGTKSSQVESVSSMNSSSHPSAKALSDSNSVSGSFREDNVFVMNGELSSVSESSEMNHDEQVLVNLMASTKLHGLNEQVQLPMQSPCHLSVAHSRTSQVLNDSDLFQMGVPNPMYANVPTGPQVPFGLPTFVPGNSDGFVPQFERSEGTDERLANIVGQDFSTLNEVHQTDTSATSTALCSTTSEPPSDEDKPDILNSDLDGHWRNLQYGRFFQNAPPMGPYLYPFMVPAMYLQGYAPWDVPGRPVAANVNWTQMVGPGQRVYPVMPVQSTTERPTSVLQHYGEDTPRYRGGTGTYLPNHVRS